MTDQSVFDSKTQDPSATTDTQPDATLNALSDQLKGIKNEDGTPKYESMPKALEALANSQTYIPQLQSEFDQMKADNQALKEQLAKTEAVEDVVSRLTKSTETPETVATPQNSGLDEEAVVGLFQRMTQQQQAQAVAEANEIEVSNVLKEAYGDKVKEVIEAKAAEMGTTPQALQQISRENPQLVLTAFQQSSSPTQTTNGSYSIPPTHVDQTNEIKLPKKSLLQGSTTAEQVEVWNQIQAKVHKENDITG